VPDPVSWLAIERGWQVRDTDGNELGKIGEVTGDANADIFDGLTVSGGVLGRARYVPSEQVAEIREGMVVVDLGGRSAETLQPFEEPPPEERVLPESSTWFQRLASWLVGRRR
jgi:hypothetical protein